MGKGTLRRSPNQNETQAAVEGGTFTLHPGRRYLLTFDFAAPAFRSTLRVKGPSLDRTYALLFSGGPKSFGSGGDHKPSLSLWTAQAEAEEVELTLALDALSNSATPEPGGRLANFVWQEYDPASLPVRLTSLSPLRFETNLPDAGYYAVTPRRLSPNYAATLNGAVALPIIRAPDDHLMVPVRAGRHWVEVPFAGESKLRWSFWISSAGWPGVVFGGGLWLSGQLPRIVEACEGGRLAGLYRRRDLPAIITASGIAMGFGMLVAGLSAPRAGQRGPLLLKDYLPAGRIGQREVLLSTGDSGAGSCCLLTTWTPPTCDWGTRFEAEFG